MLAKRKGRVPSGVHPFHNWGLHAHLGVLKPMATLSSNDELSAPINLSTDAWKPRQKGTYQSATLNLSWTGKLATTSEEKPRFRNSKEIAIRDLLSHMRTSQPRTWSNRSRRQRQGGSDGCGCRKPERVGPTNNCTRWGQIWMVLGRRQREGVVDADSKMKVPAQHERLCNFVEFERTRSNSERDLR